MSFEVEKDNLSPLEGMEGKTFECVRAKMDFLIDGLSKWQHRSENDSIKWFPCIFLVISTEFGNNYYIPSRVLNKYSIQSVFEVGFSCVF